MEQTQAKWKGKASVKLPSQRAEQVFPLLEDFFGLDKWFPTLATCLPVQGTSGQPGCVRFCAGFKTPVDGLAGINWTKQELLWINKDAMSFSYSIVESNVGFHNYVSEVKVVALEDECLVEWAYEVEPVEGWRLQDLDLFIGSGLQVMGKRMEAALQIYNNVCTN